MPWSATEGKPQAVEFVRDMPIRTVLDIGPGCGTWHTLLSPVFPDAAWTGVEIWEAYIWRFGLRAKYQRLVVGDAVTLPVSRIGWSYDLAIFGDVLEHVHKVQAVEMVARLPWRHALVSMPIIEYPQGESEGNPYEAHVATWSAEEVLATFPVVKSWTGRQIGVFLLER